MPELLVCLTFDHDNASSMISRKLTSPTMISRGDFGIVAVPRILGLLRRHAIPTTWFIPGHTIESYPTTVARGGGRPGTRSATTAGRTAFPRRWAGRARRRNWCVAMRRSSA